MNRVRTIQYPEAVLIAFDTVDLTCLVQESGATQTMCRSEIFS